MKVEVHDLKHEKWFLEAEPGSTIGELKQQNHAERKLDESSNQKMIYSGKILKDTDTLEAINYAEGKGFIVCMVSKSRKPAAAKPQPAAATAAVSATAAPTKAASGAARAPSADSEGGPAPRSASELVAPGAAPAAAQAAGAPADAPLTGPSALATGSHLNTVVQSIVEMGYSQSQALRALRKAYNNPDRAVEYLVTGQIPEDAEADAAGTEPGAGPQADDEPAGSAAGAHEGSGERQPQSATPKDSQSAHSIDRDLFDAAEEREMDEEEIVGDDEEIDFQELLGLDDDQLSELRAEVRRQPQELLRVLDPLVRSNPQVAETLVNHLDQFMWFLQSSGNADAVEEEGDGSEMALDPESRQISILPEEEEAIYRLMELGFEFDVVAITYLMCDRDEQLTANYLLEHGRED